MFANIGGLFEHASIKIGKSTLKVPTKMPALLYSLTFTATEYKPENIGVKLISPVSELIAIPGNGLVPV